MSQKKLSENLSGWELQWSDFIKVDIRVGTVLSAEDFQEAKKPAYRMQVDFGPLGVLKTSAQITDHYRPSDLIGKQVVAVVNFPTKQIANMKSECLVLAAVGEDNTAVLLTTERWVSEGQRIA